MLRLSLIGMKVASTLRWGGRWDNNVSSGDFFCQFEAEGDGWAVKGTKGMILLP